MTKSYRLVCGPTASPVKQLYTLLAPRPLAGFMANPTLLLSSDEEDVDDIKVPLVRGEVVPEIAQQLGTRACLCRTVRASPFPSPGLTPLRLARGEVRCNTPYDGLPSGWSRAATVLKTSELKRRLGAKRESFLVCGRLSLHTSIFAENHAIQCVNNRWTCCAQIVAETEAGWFELSVTAPEVDAHALNGAGLPALVTPIDGAMCQSMALEELFKFTKVNPCMSPPEPSRFTETMPE
jgi:hypothetical protein